MEETINVKQVRLEKIRIGIEQGISGKMLIDTKVDTLEDYMRDTFVMRLTGYLYGEKAFSETIEYPRDWWQAFKERWLPVWAKRRWPVIINRHTLNVKAVYTQFRPSIPDTPYSLLYTYISGGKIEKTG